MHKKIAVILATLAFLVAGAAEVSGQEVLMNSAETINKGTFKLALFPTVLFGRNGGDPLWGAAGRAGVGITSSFDIEVKGASFNGLKYYGADAEFWFVKGPAVNVSAAVGGHFTNLKTGADSSGIDASLLVSTTPMGHLELYGGLKFAFDSIKNSDENITRAHIVPGLEFRISSDLDFLAEVGIALNDMSRSYASVGLAFYLR